MKLQCQNHWYSLDSDNLDKPISEITTRIDCDAVATTIIHDDFDDTDKDVCQHCYDIIKASNWLHSPEGQAALAELDWEDDESI